MTEPTDQPHDEDQTDDGWSKRRLQQETADVQAALRQEKNEPPQTAE